LANIDVRAIRDFSMPRKHICIGMVWKLFISTLIVLNFLRMEGKPRDSDASLPPIRSLDLIEMKTQLLEGIFYHLSFL
jgi:hypothetical protein